MTTKTVYLVAVANTYRGLWISGEHSTDLAQAVNKIVDYLNSLMFAEDELEIEASITKNKLVLNSEKLKGGKCPIDLDDLEKVAEVLQDLIQKQETEDTQYGVTVFKLEV